MDKRPWTGQVYMCGECGNMFNNAALECPVCGLKAQVEEAIELGVAAATMDDGEGKGEQ